MTRNQLLIGAVKHSIKDLEIKRSKYCCCTDTEGHNADCRDQIESTLIKYRELLKELKC